MKKQTLQKWIDQQKQRARQEKQETLRTARQAALSQCESWLYALTWATMRAPAKKCCEEFRQEGQTKPHSVRSYANNACHRLYHLLGEYLSQMC